MLFEPLDFIARLAAMVRSPHLPNTFPPAVGPKREATSLNYHSRHSYYTDRSERCEELATEGTKRLPDRCRYIARLWRNRSVPSLMVPNQHASNTFLPIVRLEQNRRRARFSVRARRQCLAAQNRTLPDVLVTVPGTYAAATNGVG